MWAITLYTFGLLDSIYTSYMSLFPIIFALEDSWIHICTLNSSNIITHIKTSVDKTFGSGTTLYIPNVKPNDEHVRFQ